MDITIDKTVSYELKKVVIKQMVISKDKNNKLVLMVPYQWLDDDGKEIRNGINTYPQDLLVAAFQANSQDFTPAANALTSLLPTSGTHLRSIILFNDTATTCIGYSCAVVDNKNVWTITKMTQAQLESKLQEKGFTINILKTMVAGFTQIVFAND